MMRQCAILIYVFAIAIEITWPYSTDR